MFIELQMNVALRSSNSIKMDVFSRSAVITECHSIRLWALQCEVTGSVPQSSQSRGLHVPLQCYVLSLVTSGCAGSPVVGPARARVMLALSLNLTLSRYRTWAKCQHSLATTSSYVSWMTSGKKKKLSGQMKWQKHGKKKNQKCGHSLYHYLWENKCNSKNIPKRSDARWQVTFMITGHMHFDAAINPVVQTVRVCL